MNSTLTVSIDSGNKVGSDVKVTNVGPDLYRVEEITLLLFAPEDDSDDAIAALPNYKDVIYATPSESGNLKFVRVHERGGFTQRTLHLSALDLESPTQHKIQELIVSYGGTMVVDLGGVFTYAVPDNCFEEFLNAIDSSAPDA